MTLKSSEVRHLDGGSLGENDRCHLSDETASICEKERASEGWEQRKWKSQHVQETQESLCGQGLACRVGEECKMYLER